MSNSSIILGLDIGGANTKGALIKFKNSKIIESFSYIEYFPFWEQTLRDITKVFERINLNLLEHNNYLLKNIDKIAITITAELSDAFQTKREGISTILEALKEIYDKEKMFFISNSSEFIDFKKANEDKLSIAAANWVSSALFLGQFANQCIMIDAGSTTIDIIPILNALPVSKGFNDITRMINHELLYTGGLRATIPSITHYVPYNGKKVRISFEKFALISDVHRILDNITENQYINDTADNRSKSLEDCYARLARIICMDRESISKEDLDEIALYIYNKQIKIVSKEINLFYNDLIFRFPEFKQSPLFVITGLAAEFLIRKSLEKLGFKNIKTYEKITNIPDHISSSAFAVAGALYFQLNNVNP
ncbi:MAG: hydantoinase/oxoprolinase family protein [Promethearchaeota archaeon]